MTDENEPDQDTPDLGDAGRRALDAERRARREAERELRAAREQVATLERAELVREVASAKGLPASLADRLKGSSREELEADADSLLEVVGEKKPGPKPPGAPKEHLSGGGDPSVGPGLDAAAIAERLTGHPGL